MRQLKDRMTGAAYVALAVAVASSVVLATGIFTGCRNQKKRHVAEAVLSGMDIYYFPDDTIDFDTVTVDVTYDDGDGETLRNKVFDDAEVEDDTEFVLYTDGLYEMQAGGRGLENGDYSMSCRVVSTDDVVYLTTVTVGENYLDDLMILDYSRPLFQQEYDFNLAYRVGADSEDSYFSRPYEYRVGDDNEFVYKPVLTVLNHETGANGTFSGYGAELSVTLVDDTLNPSGSKLDMDANDYVEAEGFALDFTEEAVGKTFAVEASVPEEFDADGFGRELSPHSMEVTVCDGWNVTDAVDLGRMSLVSDEFNRSEFVTGADEKSYNNGEPVEMYWDGKEGYVGKNVYDIWEDFLKEKGREGLRPVNGIFLHGDIDVTISDIPEEFVVTEEEAKIFGVSYEEMIGSVRDRVHIYEKNLEDDFLFEGNLFTLDCSQLKWSMTRSSLGGGVDYYEENHSGSYDGSRIGFLCFQGLTDSETDAAVRKSATVENVCMLGNAIDANDTEGKGSGSVSGIMSRCAGVKVENSIVKNFLYGLYSANSYEDFFGVDADRVKVYDCYDSAMLVYYSPKNRVTNSEFMRFSGPAVTAKSSSVIDTEGNYNFHGAGVTFDSDSRLESRLSGTEAWFVSNNASVIETYIVLADGIIQACSDKTVLDEDGKINLVLATHHADGFSSGHAMLNAYFKYGDDAVPFVLNESESLEETPPGTEEELGAYNAAVTNYFVGGIDEKATLPLPITFSTNSGKIFALDTGMTGFYEPVALRNNGYVSSYETASDDGTIETGYLPRVELSEEDNLLYIYYRMNGSGLGLVVSLYDKSLVGASS